MALEPAAVTSCRGCGLQLPSYARYCARCGKPLAALTQAQVPPLWVLVLFWAGTVCALGVALAYAVALAVPNLPTQGIDPGQLRTAAAVVAVCAAFIFVGQLLASIGLTIGRPWAKGLATLICVAWGLTCLGLPVSVLALNAIWKPLK